MSLPTGSVQRTPILIDTLVAEVMHLTAVEPSVSLHCAGIGTTALTSDFWLLRLYMCARLCVCVCVFVYECECMNNNCEYSKQYIM